MNTFTSSWQPNELIFYGHFVAAIELNLCIKWRLKLPFCLFCRLYSTSINHLRHFFPSVLSSFDLATSLFSGGK